MYRKGKAAQSMRGRGGGRGNGTVNYPHSTTSAPQVQECNAPSGDMPAYLRDGLIYVAGRHLCSIKGGTLHRTFSSKSELLRGALLFRLDVLQVAIDAGARVIVATDRESGKVWRVDLVGFMQRGWSYSHPRFGEQIGLALTEWQQPGADRRDEPEQLSLFGGGR
jgi:hypothetical protein